jgi:hypothetical protein
MTTTIPPRRVVSSAKQQDTTEEMTTPKKAVMELIGVATIPLSMIAAAQQIREPERISPFSLDVYAVNRHAPAIADAVVDLAKNYPVVASVLEKLTISTPIAGLVGACFGLVAQIAENHGKLPDPLRETPLVILREDLAQEISNDAEKIREQQAASNGHTTGRPTTNPAA